MHPLIDQKMLSSIHESGQIDSKLFDRVSVLKEYGLPYDRKAENVIVSGCMVPSGLPHMLKSFARILDSKDFSYTFLSKEYCCGNYLYRPAIKARDKEALDECMSLSKEFVAKNIEMSKELGAKRLVIFCSPCYPIYKYAFPDEDIIFYPAAINEVMGSLKFSGAIDYYAGCYKLHRKFSPVPMDLKSTEDIFTKMEGLEVNRISAPQCCFTPDGLAHMIDHVKTDMMVHICTGCYGQADQNMPKDRNVEILMLPELVEKAMAA
ncbi:heterodisulfide reductase-related iron-sulfur binding cluster [Thermodesulfobacteriota bacterium]